MLGKNSAQSLTWTPKYPARRRAPMMINREPITKRTVARAMALYGTLGGLFLNCRGEIVHKQHFALTWQAVPANVCCNIHIVS